MKTILRQYKQLLTKIRRLPLPQLIVNEAVQLTKYKYVSNCTTSYTSMNKLLDDILIEENNAKLTEILDMLYKKDLPTWWYKFQLYPYTKLKSHWPCVHLIDEVTKLDSIKRDYQERLASPEFSVINWMQSIIKNEEKDSRKLELAQTYSNQTSELKQVIQEVDHLYSFLNKNKKKLDIHVPPMEAIYAPTRYGTPPPHKAMDAELKKTIVNIKKLFNKTKPISIKKLDELIDLTYAQPPINPIFYKYITNKKKQDKYNTSKAITKLLRSKTLKIQDNDIFKILRDYIKHQCYYDRDTNTYHMSKFTNFYSSKLNNFDSSQQTNNSHL